MNTIQLELLALIDAMRKFSEAYIDPKCHWSIEITPGITNVSFHTMGEHADGLKVKRTIGLEDAFKSTFDPKSPWHTMSGDINKSTHVDIFCKGLPPMCRIEEYEEEIPKEKVIQTGEKTIVKRTRICCGEAVER